MNELKKIESLELEKVVTESGLAIQEGEEIKQSYQPFIIELAEIQAQATKINFENPQQIDETIARELRLKTVKIRTGAESVKDSRKKIHLLKGNLEQAAYNLISASCKLTEETFFSVEKAREIAEKNRKELLKSERIDKLIPFGIDTTFYDLANMPNDVFENLLKGVKISFEAKIAAEKKAEEERIAKEKAEEEAREAQRLENIRLKKEAEERERLAEIERKKQAELLAAERAKAEKERKELEEKAAKLKAENDAKLEAERKERERLAEELRKKQELEEAEKAKIETQRKADEIARKKALSAPDKEKAISYAKQIESIVLPEIKSEEIYSLILKADEYLKKLAAGLIYNLDRF